MSCSLCNIRWYPEIYYYHDNKNCYLYRASILPYQDYCTALTDTHMDEHFRT